MNTKNGCLVSKFQKGDLIYVKMGPDNVEMAVVSQVSNLYDGKNNFYWVRYIDGHGGLVTEGNIIHRDVIGDLV